MARVLKTITEDNLVALLDALERDLGDELHSTVCSYTRENAEAVNVFMRKKKHFRQVRGVLIDKGKKVMCLIREPSGRGENTILAIEPALRDSEREGTYILDADTKCHLLKGRIKGILC